MRNIKRFLFVSSMVLAAVSTASAQTVGGGQTGGQGGGQGGSGGVNSGFNNESTFNSVITVPAISGISTSGRGSGAVSSYNAFGGTYWNPQALGNPMSANATSGASGFGVALYGTGTGGTNRAVGSAGGIGGAAGGQTTTGTLGGSATGGATTGFSSGISGTNTTGLTGATGLGGTGSGLTGGRAGATGLAGSTGLAGGTQNMFGGTQGMTGGRMNQMMGMMGGTTAASVVAQAGRDVTYAASFRSNVANPYTPVRVQTDLRKMFDASTSFSGGKAIEVQVLDSGVVVLRGTVKDEDEVRLVEGMTRLTPGVRDVKNELKPGG
jgi:hypothetical protein